MILRHEPRVPAVDLAGVVRDVAPAPELAVHPQPANRAPEKRPQHVGVLAVVLVPLCRLGHVVAPDRRGIRAVEHLARHERLVRGLFRPNPFVWWIDLAPALSLPPIPHLIAGVLGVVQDLPNARPTPHSRASLGVWRLWRRTAVQIAIQFSLYVRDRESV